MRGRGVGRGGRARAARGGRRFLHPPTQAHAGQCAQSQSRCVCRTGRSTATRRGGAGRREEGGRGGRRFLLARAPPLAETPASAGPDPHATSRHRFTARQTAGMPWWASKKGSDRRKAPSTWCRRFGSAGVRARLCPPRSPPPTHTHTRARGGAPLATARAQPRSTPHCRRLTLMPGMVGVGGGECAAGGGVGDRGWRRRKLGRALFPPAGWWTQK